MIPLIVTIAAGPEIDYRHITIPRMKEYADRVGADFWEIDRNIFGDVIDADSGQPGGATYWKIPLIEWLGKQATYRTMLYLDADIYVRRNAPNIFHSQMDRNFLMMAEDMHSQREFPLWKAWAAKHYGMGAPFLNDRKPQAYYNAGVFLMRADAAYEMRLMRQQFPDIHSHWGDQGLLNCWAKFMDSLNFEPLHESWNVPFPYMTRNPDEGHFLHACGIPQQDKLAWFTKLQALGI